MKSKNYIVFAVLLSLPIAAMATGLDYEFTGIATGTAGGTAFSGAAFTIQVFADSGSITQNSFDYETQPNGLDASTNEFSIDGIGSGSWTDDLEVVDNQLSTVLVLTTVDGDLIHLYSSDFATYNLQSSFPSAFYDTNYTDAYLSDTFHTTIGTVTFASISNVTFSATPSPVPEPSSWAMVAVAGVGLIGFARKHRKIASL